MEINEDSLFLRADLRTILFSACSGKLAVNMVEALFASYTAHLKNAPNGLGWHCLSRTFNT
jgi:hypothetical protein